MRSRGQRSRWGLETGQWDKTEGASSEKDPYPAWGLAPSTRAFLLKVSFMPQALFLCHGSFEVLKCIKC